MRHPEPALAALEVLALLGTLFVLSFSLTYLALAASDPAAFSQPVDKVAALFFAMTVLSTVGFGGIVAVSDVARLTVVVQMIANLVLLALVAPVPHRIVAREDMAVREAAAVARLAARILIA
jgi:hypothetical protein